MHIIARRTKILEFGGEIWRNGILKHTMNTIDNTVDTIFKEPTEGINSEVAL